MVVVCGVDEAGRGPVIGPLVMCGAVVAEQDFDKLSAIGVKDSKKLTPKQRESLFEKIKEIVVDYDIIIVDAAEIDETLNSADLNLNKLEAIKTAMILNNLQPDKAIVDSPSNNKEAYHAYLGQFLKQPIHIQLEHDAERFAPVAAASILAKVTRDRIIEELKKEYGDFGSGYPSDPKTKKFLEENFESKKELFRTSWASYKKISQKSLADF